VILKERQHDNEGHLGSFPVRRRGIILVLQSLPTLRFQSTELLAQQSQGSQFMDVRCHERELSSDRIEALLD
jgi:hypothetical protein